MQPLRLELFEGGLPVMPFRSVSILVAALALGLYGLLAANASAQEARKYLIVDTITVSDVNPDQHVLRGKDAGDATKRAFVVDDKTEIRIGDEIVALTAIEPGVRISVDARTPIGAGEDHLPIAESIVVVNVAEGS